MARRFLPLLFSQTSLRVGIKVLSVRGVVGLSANGKIRGEILPEDLLCYLFTFSLTSPLCLMYLNTVYLCVCLWRGHAFCCLPNFLCKEGGKKQSPADDCHSTMWPNEGKCLFVSCDCSAPPQAANIAPLCISSSKWDSVFDVQTSFEPLWEMKLKFVPLVNRGPCSQDPTGSPLLPSLPLVGGRRLRNVICWLQMSAEEGAALLRNTVAPPCYSELF